jgi:hypothetical protein
MIETMEKQIDSLKVLLTRHGHLLNPPWRSPGGTGGGSS